MILHWQDWMIIFLVPTIAFFLGRGVLNRNRANKSAQNYIDYFLARQQLGSGGFLATFLGANLVFTAIFLILSYEAAHRGWWVLAIPIAFLLGTALLACFYPKLRVYFDNDQTLHQALGSTFEPQGAAGLSIRRWTAIWTIISFVGLVGIEFYGGILLLKWAGEPLLHSITIVLLFAAICMGFTIAGGLRGVAAANSCLDLATGVSAFFLLWYLFRAPTFDLSRATIPSHDAAPALSDNLVFLVAAFVLFVPMPICALDSWQRGVAWKKRAEVWGWLLGGAFGIVIVSVVAIFAGLYARELGWSSQRTDLYPLRIVLEHLQFPKWIIGAVFAGFIAAILSTADELLNCCAYAWLADIRQLPRNVDEATSARYIRSAKFYTGAFGYLAAAVGIICVLTEGRIYISGIFNAVAATQVVFFLPLLIALLRPTSAPKYRAIIKISMALAFASALLSAIIGAVVGGEDGRLLIDGGPLLALSLSTTVVVIGWIYNQVQSRKPRLSV